MGQEIRHFFCLGDVTVAHATFEATVRWVRAYCDMKLFENYPPNSCRGQVEDWATLAQFFSAIGKPLTS